VYSCLRRPENFEVYVIPRPLRRVRVEAMPKVGKYTVDVVAFEVLMWDLSGAVYVDMEIP